LAEKYRGDERVIGLKSLFSITRCYEKIADEKSFAIEKEKIQVKILTCRKAGDARVYI
jgi:hypothetical protein